MAQLSFNSRNLGPSAWEKRLVFLLAFLLVASLIGLLPEPIKDGDLWWQMAYGRYFLENHTIVPDHTVFSWTPAEGDTIYCGWLSQIFFYLLYKIGGVPAIFIFRFFCMSVFLCLFLGFCRGRRILMNPLVWFLGLVGLFMSKTAFIDKPEIITYVFMNLIVWLWWCVKTSESEAFKLCYLFPVLMLLWVNAHGGFMFGLVFLGLVFIGDLLNRVFRSEEVLATPVRKHFYLALLLCCLAVFITPYGWHYPLQLLKMVLGGTGVDMISVAAFRAPTESWFNFYIEYLYVAGFTWIVVFIAAMVPIGASRIDWALVLTNITFGWLYAQFFRTTFYWAPVFAFSTAYLLSQKRGWLWNLNRRMPIILGLIIFILGVTLAGREVKRVIYKPTLHQWFGFGISYNNPVEESAFIRRHFSGCRLGNSYDIGGYLLWDLWPETKIFIDPRCFPFSAWYEDYYYSLGLGRNVAGFIKKYPCDLWIVRLTETPVMQYFLDSPDWKLAFYGASSVIFMRSHIKSPPGAEVRGESLRRVKNVANGAILIRFALIIKDFEGARMILDGMKKSLHSFFQPEAIRFYQNLIDGIISYHHKDYQRAIGYLEENQKFNFAAQDTFYRRYLIRAYLDAALQSWSQKDIDKTMTMLEKVLAADYDNAYALFNLGSIYYVLKKDASPLLKRFLKASENNKKIPMPLIELAQNMIQGRYKGQPLLVWPQTPI